MRIATYTLPPTIVGLSLLPINQTKMRIYFLGTITGGREFVDHYKFIVKTLEELGHVVLSKQTADDKISQQGEPLTSSFLFDREKQKIDLCDLLVAEVSATGVGTGYFIHYALLQHKPVLVLNSKSLNQRQSIVIEGNPSQNLYLEHYNFTNLKTKLDKFFAYINKNINAQFKGKLIVIEGTDGVGKSTQYVLLKEYLENVGKKVQPLKFPRYDESFYGRMVKRYLNGEFGDHKTISPYLITLFYALDRTQAKDEIYDYLSHGDYVLADRYTWSNIAFRAASVLEKDRDKFIDWVDEVEYNVNKIPREDIVIVLYAPIEYVWDKMSQKRIGREYTKKTRDIHEADKSYLQAAGDQYLHLAKKYPDKAILIKCVEKGKLRSIESIHFEILQKLKERAVI